MLRVRSGAESRTAAGFDFVGYQYAGNGWSGGLPVDSIFCELPDFISDSAH